MPAAIVRNISLRPFNTFGIEARAARFVRLDQLEDLAGLTASPEWNAGPRLVLGGGSNIVFAGDFDGLVIQMALRGRALVGADDTAWLVRVAAGESWHETVLWTLDQGWPGLENLALIPGTCGAAPIQNIGAYGLELAERFAALEAFDCQTGNMVTLDRERCAFAYRDSLFKRAGGDRYLITAITLRLPRVWQPRLDYGDLRATLAARHITNPSAREVADAVIAIRQSKLPDPAVLGNAGSFFKNPVVSRSEYARLQASEPGMVAYEQADGSYKLAAGWLIERCGWKGRLAADGRVGVHERQALVLVNRGGATGAELVALARKIRSDVAERFGVELEIEPVVAGS